MATGYFLIAGDQIIDQVDVSSFDTGFFDLIREIKSKLSDDAKAAFHVISEYQMFPDEGGQEKTASCTNAVFNEIEKAWFKL